MTASDLCTDALREIGVLNASEAPGGEDVSFSLGRLNLMLDSLHAEPLNGIAQAISSLALPVASGDTIVLPPGYQALLMYGLAMDLSTAFRVAIGPRTMKGYSDAYRRVYGKDAPRPKLRTRDDGMPYSRRYTWNYLTGTFD